MINNTTTKALFLDRDGIINVDKGYVYKWEEIEWFGEIFEIIKLANKSQYKVIVLTNQSGVERGMYNESDVIKLHSQMNDYLKKKDCFIDDWMYCLSYDGPRRKPNPEMIYEAAKKHEINLSESIMIGDKVSDVFLLKKTEMLKTILVQGKYDLSKYTIQQSENVKVCMNHDELLKLMNSILSKY